MESNWPVVVLRKGEAERIVAGHPWVYSSSISRRSAYAKDGQQVELHDYKDHFIGVGLHNSQSKICVRLLEFDRVELDAACFEAKIRAALAVRKRHLPHATSFRVVNAESDFFSGLIVDKYDDVLVVQISSLGLDQRKNQIFDALTAVFSPRAIVERNDFPSRKFDGLPEGSGVARGALEGHVPITMNGLKFNADPIQGHKTGFYLDQQVNYALAARFAPGARVLDCFTFQGGFAIHAAKAGAKGVLALDQSAEALAAARANAEANTLPAPIQFEQANVFDWLHAQTAVRPHEKVIPRYDFIILDPPSFTRNRDSVPDALRGYKEIHLRAMKLLRREGTLATYCCSHHIDRALFREVILDAARDARRVLRLVESYHQSPDHPILPIIPETEYLKGFAFEVL